MKGVPIIPVLCAIVLWLGGCSDPPGVIQGTVLSIDAEAGTLTLQDETSGNAVEMVIAGADIGSPPEEGDLVRLAYRQQEGRNVAHRLMNLTRQADISGKK